MRKYLILALSLIFFLPALAIAGQCKVWYGPTLKSLTVFDWSIYGKKIGLGKLQCLPSDTTHFKVSVDTTNIGFGPALAVSGKITVRKPPVPYEFFGMVNLRAYLVSPDGYVIWQQEGMPKDANIGKKGGTSTFILINALNSGQVRGSKLYIFALGESFYSNATKQWGSLVFGAKFIKVE